MWVSGARGCDRTLVSLFIINTLVRCHFGKAVPKAVHGDSLARSGFLPLQSLAAVRSKVSYADKPDLCSCSYCSRSICSHVRKPDRCSAVGVLEPAVLTFKSGLDCAPYLVALLPKTNFAVVTLDLFALANGITARQQVSDVYALSNTQGIFQLNAQITHGAIDIRVTK